MSDAIDILDAIVINIGLDYSVTIEKAYRQEIVMANINAKLKKFFDIKQMQINKPIIIGDLENLILNVPGVVSLLSFDVTTKTGIVNGNAYNTFDFNARQNLDRGFLFPPQGGIFELRYPNDDITGQVV